MLDSQQGDPSIVGLVNTDYASDHDNKRSTTGYIFTLVGGPLCQKSIIQSLMAMSTTKAEYMATAEASKEFVWLVVLVKELGIAIDKFHRFDKELGVSCYN